MADMRLVHKERFNQYPKNKLQKTHLFNAKSANFAKGVAKLENSKLQNQAVLGAMHIITKSNTVHTMLAESSLMVSYLLPLVPQHRCTFAAQYCTCSGKQAIFSQSMASSPSF